MCAVNHKKIASDCKISVSTVKRRLKLMEEAGYIGIIRGSVLPYINTFLLFRDDSGRTTPTTSPYGYVSAQTPFGELCEFITNDRELRSFQREIRRVERSWKQEHRA
ncbi:hypothetical protein FACS1894208_11930 [Clostridia bacterium]|nr:hypothetical protein FACS1894208_11930 [Clostridia bacterium]